MVDNLTMDEIPLLSRQYNLTDGHIYRAWTSEERKIIDHATDIFLQSDRRELRYLERDYVENFMKLAEQTIDFENQNYLICLTASQAIEILGNYLRLNGHSVGLVEPCFDNLALILRRHTVPLSPIPDDLLGSSDLIPFLEKTPTTAILVISPNNPTGKTIPQNNFAKLIEHCRKYNKLLILDACFRTYLPTLSIYDQYAMLINSSINYAVIEDTGKTWPTLEIKTPILTVNKELYDSIYSIYTDFLLHVSPFGLKLMTEFVKFSISDNRNSIHRIVKKNRKALYKSIENSILFPTEEPFSSVAWLMVNGMTANELKCILDQEKIHVLAGDKFYWASPEKGKNFVRVALTRDVDIFLQATVKLKTILQKYN